MLRRLLSSDDINHQRSVAMSITVTISTIQMLTQMRCRTVAVHRRWYRSLWATTTLAVEGPTDFFVASHWLERSSCGFAVTICSYSVEQITVLHKY